MDSGATPTNEKFQECDFFYGTKALRRKGVPSVDHGSWIAGDTKRR